MKKRLFCVILALALCLELSAPVLAAGSAFTDVPVGHWAYSYVSQAVKKGWISGYGDGTFGIDDQVTYDQFYTMVVRAFFPGELSAYTGPSAPWSRSYVTVAYQHGIITPITNIDAMMLSQEGTFHENKQPVNRAEMACILSKTLFALDVMVTYDKEAVAASIPDHNEIYENYEEHILTCVGAGIISGVDDMGTFNGYGTMTRGQAAVVLCNTAKVMERSGITIPTAPDGNQQPAKPDAGLGQKTREGYTAAAGVKSSIGKKDDYPTKGNSDVVSPNGYFTGATDVEIGNARLMYTFLELVNEARAAEGHPPLQWVDSDAAEEHTLQRCNELVKNYTHERPQGKFSGEVIAAGFTSAYTAFDAWMESPGHKQTLMSEGGTDPGNWPKYLSAAKTGAGNTSRWIICIWDEGDIKRVEQWSSGNYDDSGVRA